MNYQQSIQVLEDLSQHLSEFEQHRIDAVKKINRYNFTFLLAIPIVLLSLLGGNGAYLMYATVVSLFLWAWCYGCILKIKSDYSALLKQKGYNYISKCQGIDMKNYSQGQVPE